MAANVEPALVLASQSPRRIDLLNTLGLKFQTIPSNADEAVASDEPECVVEELAKLKALTVGSSLKSQPDAANTYVLGADTVVVLGSDILGKPTSREDAYQMLMRMSGRPHKVYTGVALINAGTLSALVAHESSNVYFRSLDPAEVRAYVRTEEPMDKAGAYALQGAASAFVDRIEGCYTNIIGLPVPLTVRMLRQVGMRVLGMP